MSFVLQIRNLINTAEQKGRITAAEILSDVVRPKIATLERRFGQITRSSRLKVGGALLSTATMALVSFMTGGIAAGITAVAGASGLVYVTKELVDGLADREKLKEDETYLLWKLKSVSREQR